MPLIFITIITLFITILENIPKIKERIRKKAEDKAAPAPSVFGDDK